jgi:hypothetical protein
VKLPRRTAFISDRNRRFGRFLSAFITLGLLTGCGSATASHSDSATAKTPPPSTSCATTVASTLGEVARRVYHEAATGGDVAQAVHRVQSSTALAAAIVGGDASGARAALQALLLGQIVHVEILRGGRVFAQAGSGAAIAPVHGSIPGTSASFVLSTQPDHTFLEVVSQVTGTQMLLLGAGSTAAGRRLAGTVAGSLPTSAPAAGSLTLGGQSYESFTLTGAVYPSGPLRIVLLVPSAAISCLGAQAQTHVEALGHVGERIYREELHSADVTTTLHHLESSLAFQRAVAAANVTATHAAIDGFFEAHIHVVRVRVTIGSKLLIDDGGPYVLAPVHGTLRSGGKVIGNFTMAIQDDAGYLKLAHLFTGAEVLMRTGGRQVMGTLDPGPANVPTDGTSASGAVSYGGRSYQAYSFTGEAFPSGALHISLLLPA